MTDEFFASGYSRESFYTASTDGNGATSLMHVKVPQSVANQLGAIVATRALPEYRTTHDVVRNGLVHQLRYDADRLKDPAAVRRAQALVSHLLVVNLLQDVQNRTQVDQQMQMLAHQVMPGTLKGIDRAIATDEIQQAIALLDSRPDLQALLQAKLA